MDRPLVSVITPSYNCSRFVRECYLSIASQTIDNWEWVLTDDASSDGTAEVIREIAEEDPRVKPVFFSENCGAALSRNASIDRAEGTYLAFLDIDDYWRADKLETQLAAHRGGVVFTFTTFIQFRESPSEDGKTIDPGPARCFDYDDMLHKRATLGCSTVILDRDTVGAKRMPILRTGQDYAFWLSILKEGVSACLVPEPMTFYRILPGSLSRNKPRQALNQWKIYRKIEHLPLWRSLWAFKSYAINAMTR